MPENEDLLTKSAKTKGGWIISAALLWLATAIWLYTPYSARPYDILDFSNFLPILRSSTSITDGIADLTAYYANAHGRFNVGAFALLTIKWKLFGEDMLGWQLFRFGEMCVLAWLLFRLLRTLRISSVPAFGATVIMLASPTAAANWMIMSVAEPPGTICLLALMLLLARSSDTRPSIGIWLLLGFLTIAIGLLKEMLLAAVAVPAIVLTWRTRPVDRQGLRALLQSPRLRAIVVAGLLVSIPIIWFALNAPASSYSRKFEGPTTVFNALMPAIAILVPFAPADSSGGIPLLLALSAYVVLLVSGLGWLLRKGNQSKDKLLLCGLAIGLSMSGVAAYSPWPTFSLIYALPFQIGTAILVGLAVTEILSRTRASARLLGVACTLMALIMVASAQRYARFRSVSLEMSRDLATYIGTLESGRAVQFEVCGPPEGLWQKYGLIIDLYATSRGLTHPRLIDTPCRDLRGEKRAEGAPGIVLSNSPLRDHAVTSARAYTFDSFEWSTISLRRHSLVLNTLNLPRL